MTAAVAAVAVAAVAIGWGRRTRAGAAEKRRRLPGDELVADPMWQATRAVTIEAPRERVWPWLVQMGFPTRRAGWYTPYWLDRVLFGIRARSASVIVPELQDLAVGDRVDDSDSGDFVQAGAMLRGIRSRALSSSPQPSAQS